MLHVLLEISVIEAAALLLRELIFALPTRRSYHDMALIAPMSQNFLSNKLLLNAAPNR